MRGFSRNHVLHVLPTVEWTSYGRLRCWAARKVLYCDGSSDWSGTAGEPARLARRWSGVLHKECIDDVRTTTGNQILSDRTFFGANRRRDDLRYGETFSIVCPYDGVPAGDSLRWSLVGRTAPSVLSFPPKDKNLPSGRFSRQENIWPVFFERRAVRKKATRFRVAFFVSDGDACHGWGTTASQTSSSFASRSDHCRNEKTRGEG